MATLSGNKIKDTYQSLVKFSDNGNITVGAKQLTDGFGNNSPMFVSTTQVQIYIILMQELMQGLICKLVLILI
jgi:hypothetical protein